VPEVTFSSHDQGDGVDLHRVLAALVKDVGDLKVSLEIPSEMRLDCPDRAQALVRCVQESVTNTRKHARARALTIKIAVERGLVVVHAHDDGQFTGEVRAGNGLLGMSERFREIGGGVKAGSHPEGGFAVDAWLPLRGAGA
jgi:signal transduction histidine kinase